MPRGRTPRQPARTGRQDRVGRRTLPSASSGQVSARQARTKATATPKGQKKSGYNPLAPDRISEILKRLDQLYPDVTCALTHTSAWELLVATILSAQSTDVNVNRVTPELFRKYPTVEAFAALTPEQLQPDVRSTGFFRNKSKSVVGAAKKVVADFGGQVPDDMEKLRRDAVDVDVGGLGREDGRDQKFPGIRVRERASNSGIELVEALQDLGDAVGG